MNAVTTPTVTPGHTTVALHLGDDRPDETVTLLGSIFPEATITVDGSWVRVTSSDDEVSLFVSDTAATPRERELALLAYIDTHHAYAGDPGFYIEVNGQAVPVPRDAYGVVLYTGISQRDAARHRATALASFDRAVVRAAQY